MQSGRRTALHAGLADPLVALGGLNVAAAFADIVAHRLFDIHILAGLHGPDRGQRMPMVRRGNRDEVDRLVVEHGPQILRIFRLVAMRILRGSLAAVIADFRIDIADVGEFDVPVRGSIPRYDCRRGHCSR